MPLFQPRASLADNVHYVNSDWAKVRRDISGEKRRIEAWFVDEYLPMVQQYPEFARLWRESFFTERVQDAVRSRAATKVAPGVRGN